MIFFNDFKDLRDFKVLKVFKKNMLLLVFLIKIDELCQ